MLISRRRFLGRVGSVAAAGMAFGLGIGRLFGLSAANERHSSIGGTGAGPLSALGKGAFQPEGSASGRIVPSVAEDGAEAPPQWGLVIDLRRCDGCAECTIACQRGHLLTKSQEWIKVYRLEDHEGNTFYMPRPCMHCEHPPCLKVCPVAATFRNDEGVVLVDQHRCIGCRACMAACPYNARYFNFWETPKPPKPYPKPTPEFPVPQERGTVGKCDICAHLTHQGLVPHCVEACRMGAIYIAELNMDVMTNRAGETYRLSQFLHENDAFRFKEELNTNPRVWYVRGHGQALTDGRWSS